MTVTGGTDGNKGLSRSNGIFRSEMSHLVKATFFPVYEGSPSTCQQLLRDPVGSLKHWQSQGWSWDKERDEKSDRKERLMRGLQPGIWTIAQKLNLCHKHKIQTPKYRELNPQNPAVVDHETLHCLLLELHSLALP